MKQELSLMFQNYSYINFRGIATQFSNVTEVWEYFKFRLCFSLHLGMRVYYYHTHTWSFKHQCLGANTSRDNPFRRAGRPFPREHEGDSISLLTKGLIIDHHYGGTLLQGYIFVHSRASHSLGTTYT